MIPGVDEKLRVNGAAWLTRDPGHLQRVADGKRAAPDGPLETQEQMLARYTADL